MAAAFEPRSSLRSSQQQQHQQNNNALRSSTNSNPYRSTQSSNKRTMNGGNSSDFNNGVNGNNALPSLDFGFEDLRRQMTSFTTHFDDFIGAGRRDVLDARNAHRTQLSELNEETELRGRGISIVQQQQAAHTASLRREAAETAELETAVSSLTANRDAAAGANADAAREIEGTRAAIAEREAKQKEYADRVSAQARLNAPELAFYEDYLGLRIESPADDEICFVFTCIDSRRPEQEFEVTLDLSRRDYAIKECHPKLDDRSLSKALDRLNEGRELAPFLKEIRGAFQEKARAG